MIPRHAAILVAALAMLGIPSAGAQSQAYPAKPVRILIGYPTGGPLDVVTRMLAQDVSSELGQPFVVENRTGASGLIATDAVARSPADGHTLLATASTFIVNPLLMDKVQHDPIKDFTAISHIAVLPVIAVTGPDSRASSMQDLVGMAKASPQAVAFASAGVGGPSHLAGELLQAVTGTKMTHIPTRGSIPALTEVMSGRVALTFYPMTGLKQHVTQGRVKPLAIAAESRHPDYPSVPTMAEAGFPQLTDVGVWFGLVAPAGTPPSIVTLLSEAIDRSLARPETREKLKGLGVVAVGGPPAKFTAFLERDLARWSRVIKAAGIKADGS